VESPACAGKAYHEKVARRASIARKIERRPTKSRRVGQKERRKLCLNVNVNVNVRWRGRWWREVERVAEKAGGRGRVWGRGREWGRERGGAIAEVLKNTIVCAYPEGIIGYQGSE